MPTETGVGSLKIRHNNVLGYFIEVTATTPSKLLKRAAAETFIHRQTHGQRRSASPRVELAEIESARSPKPPTSALALELDAVRRAASTDVLAERRGDRRGGRRRWPSSTSPPALAELAAERRYVPAGGRRRACDFDISGGRHPVVEAALAAAEGARFVANDCDLGAGERRGLWLLTGPNMAGKIDLPAPERADRRAGADRQLRAGRRSAEIGVVDRLFSRVGAADDLARGRSTFMVEMVETAAILNQAGAAGAGDPGRDRPRHGDLRRPVDRLGVRRAPARGEPLPRPVRHPLPRADRAGGQAAPPAQRHAMRGARSGRAKSCSCTRSADGAADRSYGIHVARLGRAAGSR